MRQRHETLPLRDDHADDNGEGPCDRTFSALSAAIN